MEILVEQHGDEDLVALNRSWSAPATFAFLPGRTSVPASWVSSALDALPSDLERGHFALLTSGSTGTPKLVIGDKRLAEGLVRVLHGVQQSEAVRQAIVALPLSYCYSFVNQWLWAKVFERALILTKGLSQRDSLHMALAEARDAMLCLVGSQGSVLTEVFPNERFEGVTRLHFAGGAFPQSHLSHIREIFPAARIFNNYGCTEAMPRLTVRPAEESGEASDIGFPIPGVELRAGVDGEIEFRSPYRAVAFFDDSGLHRLSQREWLPTGDLGVEPEQGRWQITGRANEVFKRHGEKIGLPSLLRSLEDVWSGAAAFYRERDPSGEEGHVLVLAPAPADSNLRAILQIFRSRHTRAQWPLRIESLELLPLLPSGKYDVAGIERSGKAVHWRQRL